MINRYYLPCQGRSANDFLYKGKTSYNYKTKKVVKRNKVYKDYFNMLKEYIDSRIGQAPFKRTKKCKARLDILSVRSRRFDHINFASGCKPILDILKRLGWFYDDTETYLLDKYYQVNSPDKTYQGLYISLECVDELPAPKYSIEDIIEMRLTMGM